MKGKTASGFSFDINDSVTDDYELLEDLASEDNARLPKILVKILGKDQELALREHVRNEAGIVTVTAMTNAMQEIFAAIDASKNS